nr:Rz1-like lysis system protein LysC [Pantoea agglomerans]
MTSFAAGLMPLCLILLSGCASVRPSPEVSLTVSGCPRITPCRLDEAAWAACADKVDTIISCQDKEDEQAAILAKRPE